MKKVLTYGNAAQSKVPSLQFQLLSYSNLITRVQAMSGKRQTTFIHYHVPEDHDDPQQPNVFAVPLHKSNLKLSHIYQFFPLKGSYIFRFKFAHDGFIVWLDLPDLEAKVPLYKDKIHLKASRVSWNDSKVLPTVKEVKKQPQIQAHPVKQNIDLFDTSHHQAVNVPKKEEKKSMPQPVSNHFDILNDKPAPKTNNMSDLNLLGGITLNSPAPPSSASQLASSIDFFGGMTSTIPSSVPTTLNPQPPKKQEINLMHGFQKHGDLI